VSRQRYCSKPCGPQKLDVPAVKGFPRPHPHDCMAHTALDISPRSRNNMTEKA
jgi:hypothetical protein